MHKGNRCWILFLFNHFTSPVTDGRKVYQNIKEQWNYYLKLMNRCLKKKSVRIFVHGMPVPFVRKDSFLWISMSGLENYLSCVLLFIYFMYNKGLQLCEICPWRKQRSLMYLGCDRWSLRLLLWWELSASVGFNTSMETTQGLKMFIRKMSSLYWERWYYYTLLYMQEITTRKKKKKLHAAAEWAWMSYTQVNLCFNRPAVRLHCATEAVECMCVNVTLF